MSTINEEIITGRKFRKLVDGTTKLWQRISFWTKASDVECEDGKTVEEKLTQLNSNMGGFKLKKLTQAEYNTLSTKEDHTIYFTV